MGSILSSLSKTVIAGFVLLGIIVAIFGNVNFLEPAWLAFAFRWLHVMVGVMWIGLLWYFNFVQIPSMPKISDEHKPAISKVIAPEALFWFRYSALLTVITGLIVAWLNGYGHNALMLGEWVSGNWNRYVVSHYHGYKCVVYYLAKSKKGFRHCRR